MYSKLVSWTVENFMSIKRGVCEFDERGIINLKGYNDSGKSAMLRALDVLFFNIRPNSQVNFIMDDADYFRIIAKFDDGVFILRDKYSNGQSLYEMYKGNELIYSTKVNGVLSKVSTVPEPIQLYLGLIEYDGTLLNSRTCFEKQLLVQTTGGDNYKLLNVILKSEELATAGNLLNNDRNKLGTDIANMDSSLRAYKEMLAQNEGITEEMVSMLEQLDGGIDSGSLNLESLRNLSDLVKNIQSIFIYDNIDVIDPDGITSSLYKLLSISKEIASLNVTTEVPVLSTDNHELLLRLSNLKDSVESIGVMPLVGNIDNSQYKEISEIFSIFSKLEGIVVQPVVNPINLGTITDLFGLNTAYREYCSLSNEIDGIDADLQRINSELESYVVESNGRFIKCPNCGEVIEV